MGSRTETVLSALLALSAVLIAGSLFHREFIETTDAAPAQGGPPEFVRDWEAIERVGIRVGPETAKVRVVAFSDFECSFCKTFAAQLQAAQKRFPGQISYSFVHYPLETIHRFAHPAARAAECADEQGQFESMHDVLYAKQDSFGLKSWGSFAAEARVRDTIRFAACLASSNSPRRIADGIAAGDKVGVLGTPTVLINGWKYAAPPTADTLARFVTSP